MDVQKLMDGIKVLKLERGDRLAIHITDATTEETLEFLDALRHVEEDWGVKILILSDRVELSVVREGD